MPSASVTLSSSSADVQIVKGSATFSASDDQTTVENSLDAFTVKLALGKYGLDLPFHLEVTAGGTQSFDFTVQSESQSMNYSGNITFNTQWLNSRIYHVTGNLTVKNTAILTIQPGTQIFIDPGFFIKIEGTLIADGSEEAPIIFTTSSANSSHWIGLTFTDLAVPAVFEANGVYQSGSILRYVNVSFADTGVLIQTKAPYFSNNLFENNTIGINQGSASSPRIENSIFNTNGFDSANVIVGPAITLTGGAPKISENVFKDNGNAISYSSSDTTMGPIIQNNLFLNSGTISVTGSSQILNNTISGFTSYAWNGVLYLADGSATVYGNRMMGNRDGIRSDNLTELDMQHNLIADNGTACSSAPCSNSPVISLTINGSVNYIGQPAVAYNSDLDEFAIAWMEMSSNYEIKVSRLSASGDPVGTTYTYSGTNTSIPAIVYNPQKKEYLLLIGGNGIKAQRLSDDLEAQGSPLMISDFGIDTPKLVYQSADDLYLVAWHGTPSGGSDGIYAQYLTGENALSGGMLTVGDPGNIISRFADVAYDPGLERSLVVYGGSASGCSGCLLGSWITSTGSPSVLLNWLMILLVTLKTRRLPLGERRTLMDWHGGPILPAIKLSMVKITLWLPARQSTRR